MRVRHRVQAVIDHLHYDFTAFDIQHLLHHLQTQRNRPIQVIDFSFAQEIYGVWIPAEGADYIFVNANLLPAHRVHTLLHEIAHMLLNHRGIDVREVLGETLWSALGVSSTDGHLRAATPSEAIVDDEAEVFVLLFQQRVTHARRLQELFGEPTSLPSMQPYVSSLDFNS